MSQALTIYPVNILQWVIAFTALFSAILLWSHSSYRLLIFILIKDALLMLLNFGEETGLLRFSVLLTPLFTFFTGPALYLFVRQMVYPDILLHRRDALHFLPFTLALPFLAEPQWVIGMGSVSLTVYLMLSIRAILRYERVIVSVSSDAKTLSLGWMLGVIGLLILLILTDFLRMNLQPKMSCAINMNWYFAQLLGVFLILLYLVYRAMQAPALFTRLRDVESSDTLVAEQAVTVEYLRPIFEQVDRAIKGERLYLQPRLSVLDLSQQYGLQAKDISAAINRIEKKNFNDYINALRLDAWRNKIDVLSRQERQRLSVLTLAMEVGFNSKSAFNQAFKKHLAMTPSQYLSRLT